MLAISKQNTNIKPITTDRGRAKGGQMMRLSPDYLHCSKDAVSRGAQTFGRAVLKCFDLDEHAHRLTVDTRSKAQTALTGFASALTDDIAGFAILHQISASICSLLITRWRGNTELWQSVHYLDRPLSAFAPFHPA